MSSAPDKLNITAVRIYPFDTRETGGRTVAYAEIEVEGLLLLRGLRILESDKKGLFIGYPSQRVRQDTFVDTVVPLTRSAALAVRTAVLDEYKRMTGWEPEKKEGEGEG